MPSRFLGLEWAPLSIPMERRLQTLAVVLHIMTLTLLPLVSTVILLWLLTTSLWFVTVGYVTWIVFDVCVLRTPQRGGRRVQSFRRSKIATYFQQYFPAQLIKTADLDPERNYIFGAHPHGIKGDSVLVNFGTEATGFSSAFPGLTPHAITLAINFKMPLIRSYFYALGACDSSPESIQWLLNENGLGNVAVIAIGGAAESLEAKPGSYKLTLKNRKGFVKMALQSGAALVPVFTFGENDLYHQADNPKGSLVRSFQEAFKQWTGFTIPFFYGRGVFNYTLGLLPLRTPMTTVVGAPIHVPKIIDPVDGIVDDFHQKYMDALARLFDSHKTQYGVDENTQLEFV